MCHHYHVMNNYRIFAISNHELNLLTTFLYALPLQYQY